MKYLLAFILSCSCFTASAELFQTPIDKKVDSILAAMTLEQKIGQKLMVDIKPSEVTPELKKFLQDGQLGNIILFQYNLKTKVQVKQLTQALQQLAPHVQNLPIPFLIALDQEGGTVDRLKHIEASPYSRVSSHTIGKLYAKHPSQALTILEHAVDYTAGTFQALGINMNLAPVLDLSSNTQSFIFKRSFGSQPKVVTKLGIRYIESLQHQKIIATAKHFPNLGDTPTDSHAALPTSAKTADELWDYEFYPFRAVAKTVSTLMVGHVMLSKIDSTYPSSISPKVISILRNQIGFDGVILCDDIRMKALSDRFPLETILLSATTAGIDIIMMAWDEDKKLQAVRFLTQAVRSGKISLKTIDDSVRRILKLKFQYL